MAADFAGRVILGVVPEGAVGPSRSALLLALIDRARHDHAFGVELRCEPDTAAQRMGVTLRDSEWAGLRDLLNG